MDKGQAAALCALLVVAAAIIASADASAASGPTAVWEIRTFSGGNETRTFTYPGTINVTVLPLNVSVSGQRSLTIGDAVNASRVYLSTSIGFFAAQANYSPNSTINVSWSIPGALQDGATLLVAVGLTGVKSPESSLLITVQANISHVVHGILDPIFSYFQSRITQLESNNAALQGQLADSDFHHTQIEAVLGFVIAGLVADKLYSRRKKQTKNEAVEASKKDVIAVIAEGVADREFTRESVAKPTNGDKQKGA